MTAPTNFRVLDAARLVVDDINRWLDASDPPVADAAQLREAAGSITSNIREAYGREAGPDRKRFLRYACGSAEETDERTRTALGGERVEEPFYWRQHHRITVIVRMLNSIMKRQRTRRRRSNRRKKRRK
jgi:four helix bundle protein